MSLVSLSCSLFKPLYNGSIREAKAKVTHLNNGRLLAMLLQFHIARHSDTTKVISPTMNIAAI
jgi:hypothetical protein